MLILFPNKLADKNGTISQIKAEYSLEISFSHTMQKGSPNCFRANKNLRIIICLIAVAMLCVFGSYLFFQVQMTNTGDTKTLCYMAGEIISNTNLAEPAQKRNGKYNML